MRTQPSTFCDLIVGRSTVRSVDVGWLDLWAWVAGREGQLPGGFAVGDRERSLPRLAVSRARGFSFCYQRTWGCFQLGPRVLAGVQEAHPSERVLSEWQTYSVQPFEEG